MNKLFSFVRSNVLVVSVGLLCVIAVFIICYPAGLYFLCDDFAHVPLSISGNLFQTNLLRPVPAGILWLDTKLWHVNAEGFHVTNLVLHVINTYLVFLLSGKLLRRYAANTPHQVFTRLLVTLLFLCYAFHSEPVFWISGRGGSLAALFIQVSLLCYFKEKKGYLIFGLCSFAIGLFTYELTWIVPLLVTAFFVYEVYYQKRKKSFLPVTLYWNVLTAYLFLRYFVLKGSLSGYEAGNVLHRNYFSLIYNYAALTGRLFLPPMESGWLFLAFFSIGISIFLGVLLKVYKKSGDQFAFILLLFICLLISLLPVISLGIDTHDTESERFIYPGSIFACLLIVFVLNSLVKKTRQVFGFIVLILICHLYLLYKASTAYRYASYVAKFTIESLNKVTGVKHITFTNLPSQYKGGLIFRIGFIKSFPGVLKNTYDSVTVLSYKEIIKPVVFSVSAHGLDNLNPDLYVDFTDNKLLLHQ